MVLKLGRVYLDSVLAKLSWGPSRLGHDQVPLQLSWVWVRSESESTESILRDHLCKVYGLRGTRFDSSQGGLSRSPSLSFLTLKKNVEEKVKAAYWGKVNL